MPNDTLGIYSPDDEPPEGLGFNWGAFLFPEIWLMFHGKVIISIVLLLIAGLIYLVGLISSIIILFYVISIVFNIVVGIYFGSKGNEIAWRYKHYRTMKQMEEDQRPWMVYGVLFYFLVVYVIFIQPLIWNTA